MLSSLPSTHHQHFLAAFLERFRAVGCQDVLWGLKNVSGPIIKFMINGLSCLGPVASDPLLPRCPAAPNPLQGTAWRGAGCAPLVVGVFPKTCCPPLAPSHPQFVQNSQDNCRCSLQLWRLFPLPLVGWAAFPHSRPWVFSCKLILSQQMLLKSKSQGPPGGTGSPLHSTGGARGHRPKGWVGAPLRGHCHCRFAPSAGQLGSQGRAGPAMRGRGRGLRVAAVRRWVLVFTCMPPGPMNRGNVQKCPVSPRISSPEELRTWKRAAASSLDGGAGPGLPRRASSCLARSGSRGPNAVTGLHLAPGGRSSRRADRSTPPRPASTGRGEKT